MRTYRGVDIEVHIFVYFDTSWDIPHAPPVLPQGKPQVAAVWEIIFTK
jgi:hypothetical protein